MQKLFIRLMVLLVLVVAAGCGGSGGDTPATVVDQTPVVVDPVVTPPVTVSKASDFTGNWSGLYAVGAETVTPVTLDLAGVDGNNSVSGKIYSADLSGPFTGTVNTSTGAVTGTVVNKVDQNTWAVGLGMVNNELKITSATYGAASLGTGSCTATPVLGVDMSGSWVGEIVEVNSQHFVMLDPAVSTLVAVELAYDARYGDFVGVITGDKGLVSKIRFSTATQYWFCRLTEHSNWGTSIVPPTYNNTLYTQAPISSVANMVQSFTENPTKPERLQWIYLVSQYNFTETFLGNTISGVDHKEYRMSLSRPPV